MENLKVAITTSHTKLSLRELNLGQAKGGSNVRWLNDREERLLQTSLTSLEKAHKKTLNRLQNEVKGLHHTLREQVTVRSPQPTKEAHLPDKGDTETKRPSTTIHTVTFNLQGEILAQSRTEEGTRISATEEFEEHIALEDNNNHTPKTSERGLGKTNSQSEANAWTRKVSSALKRPLIKQLSSSSEHSSSSTNGLSAPRRKISVTDPPPTKELSPRLRKSSSQNSLLLSANATSNRAKTRSAEMINAASTHHGGSALNDSLSPSLRKVSAESVNRVASPLFLRRKLSHHHAPRQPSPPRMVRKISCPPQVQHLPSVHQEEVIPLQLSRDNSGNASRAGITMTTDLPKLDMSRGIESGSPFEGNVSPLGLHDRGMDCTLQEKVNNFLRSLDRSDDTHEHKEKAYE